MWWLHVTLIPLSLAALIIRAIDIVLKWDKVPYWVKRIPCIFQSIMNEWFFWWQNTNRVMGIFALAPMFIVMFCSVMYLSGWNKQKRPWWKTLIVAFLWKVIIP